MTVERTKVMTSARVAGGVVRYHTWPTILNQTVADHTWHVMRIWWTLFGPMPPHVSTYLLWHDAGELFTGDLPFPIKSQNQHLKGQLDFLEEEGLLRIGGPMRPVKELSPAEKSRTKVCDLIEMMEYGRHEMTLGNRFAQPIVDDLRQIVGKFMLEPDDAFEVQRYLDQFDQETARVFDQSA